MKKIIVASLAIALAGCGPSEEEIRAKIEAEQKAAAEVKAKEEAAKAKKVRDALIAQVEAVKVACSKLEADTSDYGKLTGCSYSNTDNYHKFRINGFQSSLNYAVNEILFKNFKFPPQAMSKIEATSAVMGLQEATMDGAKLSWDMQVNVPDGLTDTNVLRFNFEVL